MDRRNEFNELLYSDIDEEDELPNVKPLLAHYATLLTLENILKNSEIWLSNPLFMNDYEEVRFGINMAMSVLEKSEKFLSSMQTQARAKIFIDEMRGIYEQYGSKHIIDLYVFCLSKFDPGDSDGKLSMWRGYGDNGNGVALVFDTAKIQNVSHPALILSKVEYLSRDDRVRLIEEKVEQLSDFFRKNDVSDLELRLMAPMLFERICVFSIFTKHKGFSEEDEWRLVYLRSRDHDSFFDRMFDYFNGPRGVEPKLKLRVNELLAEEPGASFDELVERIVIGPTAATPIALMSLKRMLEKLGHGNLAEKVVASTIPYRA